MAGYIGSKAVLLSTTAAVVTGDAQIGGDLTVDTNALFVDAANNRVGVGTSSPTHKLTVGGYSNVNASNKLAIGDNAGYQALIYMESANETLTIENTSDYAGRATIFKDNGVERARVDASGNLLVGMTATTSSVTYGGVYIRGDTNSGPTNDYAQVFVQNNSSFNHGVVIKELGAGGNAVRFMNNAGTNVGSITTTASSTAYNTSSDYRLKEDVQPMVGASDRLMALKPVNFAWKTDGSRVDGFLAHEAQEVVPECVTGQKDQTEIVEIKDEDGNVTGTEERPVYQGIDQSKLVPLLTAALQEALQKIDALEARIVTLEGGAA